MVQRAAGEFRIRIFFGRFFRIFCAAGMRGRYNEVMQNDGKDKT